METIYKDTTGKGRLYKIRKALENEKHWVVEVYFDNREYPNIISGRYKTKKNAREAIGEYQHSDKFCFWGDV